MGTEDDYFSMLSFSRFLFKASVSKLSLTGLAMTRQLSQKGVRRPQKAQILAQRERIKKRRRERQNDIAAKYSELERTMRNENVSCRDLAMAQLANLIFSKGHQHIATATNISFVPDGNPSTPLVALAGRSLVGKTALLRALFRSPREVGKSNRFLRREGMNFFNVGSTFNIVDLPGFGGTSIPWGNVLQYANLLRNFSRFQPSLKMIYYCLDVNYKHGLYMQDVDILRFMSSEVPNFTVLLTKADQLNENEKATNAFRIQDIREELIINGIEHPVLVTSAFKMGGIDTLRFDMVFNCLHALPTERLTYTEAKRLSDRLFSQAELCAVRGGSSPTLSNFSSSNEASYPALSLEKGEKIMASTSPSTKDIDTNTKEITNRNSAACLREKENLDETNSTEGVIQRGGVPGHLEEIGKDHPDPVQHHLVKDPGNDLEEAKIKEDVRRVNARLANTELMKFVQQTSPWRNPLLWPSNVVSTKSLKANIMRCPADPTNPYLYQSHFVVGRADMYFRKPNCGIRKSMRKGRLELSNKKMGKVYTIPYFPEIVEVNMHPTPWMFVGSKEAYYERSGGKELGIQLTNLALESMVNPFSDVPAPNDKELTNEIKLLEEKKYTPSISMLEPPS